MRIPAKLAFSPKYRSNGICGALGLSDQGCSSDMVQMWTREDDSAKGGIELGEGGSGVKKSHGERRL